MRPKTKNGTRIGRGFAYKDQKVEDARSEFLAQVFAMGSRHFDCYVEVAIEYIFKRPKKQNKPYPRADCDNLSKFVLDALQPKVISNDDYVQRLIASKRYGEIDGYIIKIRRLHGH